MSHSIFLPICKEDMEQRKIEQLDFVYVCGDAYVDHPSFGHPARHLLPGGCHASERRDPREFHGQ